MLTGSQPKISGGKIYFGWWIVLFSGLISGLGAGFYYYGISVFFKQLTAELGVGRAITSFGSSIGRLEGGVISPLTGWLGDKFGPKWMIFIGVCLVALGLGLMYFIKYVWQYFVVWGLITGLGLNLGLTVAIDLTLTNWFIRKRGMAMGIKFALIGLGAIIAVPAVTWLVNWSDWRTACLVWSLVMLACLPLVLIFMKSKRPEYYGLLPDGARIADPALAQATTLIEQGKKYASDVQEVDFTLKQAIRTRSYWVIAISFTLFAFVSGGFVIHSVPLLTDIGLTPSSASQMLSLMVVFTLPSRFFAGLIADRIQKGKLRFVLAVIFGMMLIGLASFLISPTKSRVLFLLIPYGLSSGAVTPIVILLIGRYYGRRSFGSIFGSCMLFNAVPQLISPVYAGWIYDMTGSYASALTVFAVLVAAATIVICFAASPRFKPALST